MKSIVEPNDPSRTTIECGSRPAGKYANSQTRLQMRGTAFENMPVMSRARLRRPASRPTDLPCRLLRRYTPISSVKRRCCRMANEAAAQARKVHGTHRNAKRPLGEGGNKKRECRVRAASRSRATSRQPQVCQPTEATPRNGSRAAGEVAGARARRAQARNANPPAAVHGMLYRARQEGGSHNASTPSSPRPFCRSCTAPARMSSPAQNTTRVRGGSTRKARMTQRYVMPRPTTPGTVHACHAVLNREGRNQNRNRQNVQVARVQPHSVLEDHTARPSGVNATS